MRGKALIVTARFTRDKDTAIRTRSDKTLLGVRQRRNSFTFWCLAAIEGHRILR